MKKIEKLSDLVVGENYFFCFVQDGRFAKPCKLLAIVNEEPGRTELYLENTSDRYIGTNLVYAQEIGIGYTKQEAVENYGEFTFEEIAGAWSKFADAQKSINWKG